MKCGAGLIVAGNDIDGRVRHPGVVEAVLEPGAHDPERGVHVRHSRRSVEAARYVAGLSDVGAERALGASFDPDSNDGAAAAIPVVPISLRW